MTQAALADHMLARIARLDPELHSYAFLEADGVRRQAERAETALERGEKIGPLHGVPVAVKDLFWTKDMPSAAGMPMPDAQPPSSMRRILRLVCPNRCDWGLRRLHRAPERR